jgi:hypothetical protein
MSNYRVNVTKGPTIIERPDCSFKMRVQRDVEFNDDKNTALLEATLYKESGSFIVSGYFLFEALDKQNEPLIKVDIDEFKHAVDFFFTSLLDTEHYVKEIPKASSLCNSELKSFQF